MSEQNPGKAHASDQLTDILLVYDKEKMKIQAVKGVDKNGELETVEPTKKNQGQFMRVDKHGDPFSNFFSNFIREVKDPTRFSFLKVPMEMASKVASNLRQQFKDGIFTPEGRKILEQHEVRPGGVVVQTYKDGVKLKDPIVSPLSSHLGPDDVPAKSTGQDQPVPATEPTSAKQEPKHSSQETQYRYQPEQVDWDSLAKFGVIREKLEKDGMMDDLMKGFKSNKLVPVSINTDTLVFKGEARLSLRTNDQDKVVAQLHGVRKEPQLDLPFFGHKFTDEDKSNLLQTGNMGRVVDLTNPKTGAIIPSYVSIDRLTDEVVALRASAIKIPDVMKGVKLNEEQKQTLAEGKSLYLEGMMSAKNKPFSATLQVNADKGYIEFRFNRNQSRQQSLDGQQQQDAPRIFRGYALNEEQYQRFNSGKSVLISGLTNKDGKPYQIYIKHNFETKKTESTFYDPDKVRKQATQADGHKTQSQSTPEAKQKQQEQKPKAPKKSAGQKR